MTSNPVPPRETYPLVPLKNVVILPHSSVTLLVGRARSVQAVDEAMAGDRRLAVTTQRDVQQDEPSTEHLYPIGTLGEITHVERQAGGNVQVVLRGLARVRLRAVTFDERRYEAHVAPALDVQADDPETRVLFQHIKELAVRLGETKGRLSAEALETIARTESAGAVTDILYAHLVSDVVQRQRFLETLDVRQRLDGVAVLLTGELDVIALEQKIKDRVREQIDKNQREYYLREQLKAIHDELSGDNGNEIQALRDAVAAKGLQGDGQAKLLKEIGRLEKMPPISAEGTVVRTYIDWVLSLPWNERDEDRLDLVEAERLLDADHHGLKRIKERILEFLAVRKLTHTREQPRRSAILCLAGPPGVGKTSLGMSIAKAMNRKFVRISLGGVRDEAEIRGHRRTYIGAMPGRLIQALKSAGSRNPVILLDEIDKMSSDYRGDPASAMLEVLDTEQNHAFVDHYIDIPFDLSEVLFITTANVLWNIPKPLRDRMEVVELEGYTEYEKIEIARRHLLPKQLQAHGLEANRVEVPERLLHDIIRRYTREAGVRSLERQLATICRKAASLIVRGRTKRLRLTPGKLAEFLGSPRFGFEQHFGENQVGVSIGLSWTEYGGEVLPIEVVTMVGRGAVTLTGRLGDVMQESAKAALSYARSRSRLLGIADDFQEKIDLHIHVPEGAIPKDGPSAGISMGVALISALTRRPVRHDVAMTGEITLRGRVLPIGGLKEKVLAAHRSGLRRIVAPAENQRDLQDIPREVARDMTFYWVEDMDQVIAETLESTPIAIAATDQADAVAKERPTAPLPPVAGLPPDLTGDTDAPTSL